MCRRPRRGDGDVGAGVETEPSHDPPDQVDIVTREYAEMITGWYSIPAGTPARYGEPTARRSPRPGRSSSSRLISNVLGRAR